MLAKLRSYLSVCPTVGVCLVLAGKCVHAGDWPQILGPLRNGLAANTTLPDQLPAPLTAKVSYPLGAGYAGPAVVGPRAIVFHRSGNQELLEALDWATGQRLWQTTFPAEYEGSINRDSGPRCVPLVHADHVYAFGASGRMHCVALSDGKTVWSRHLAKDYDAPEGYFGAGSTPIVVADRLLVNLGGRAGAGVVALDLANGQTVWTATDEQASYSSPTPVLFQSQPHALFLTRLNLVAVDPQSGQVRFRHPFGRRGPTVNAAVPLVIDNQIFLSASYNIGAELVAVTDDGRLATRWKGDDILSSQYTTAIYHQGFLYGNHGREDEPALAELRCVDARNGQVRWQRPGAGMSHLILAGDRILAVEVQTGSVAIFRASPLRYEELGRQKVTDETLRALPALAGDTLLLHASTTDTSGRLLVLPLR